jgi:hypothetical protein
MTMPEIDDLDREIIAEREKTFNKQRGLRVGDWIDFADGVQRRVSYIWPEDPEMPKGIQTSEPASGFYLGNSGVSMGNGGLYRSVSSRNLTLTTETRPGSVWMAHHGCIVRDSGVDFTIPFRVWTSTDTAPTS